MPCLSQRTLRRLLTLATLTLLSATLALAQNPSVETSNAMPRAGDWQASIKFLQPGSKVNIYTTTHPNRSHSCKVQSFDDDKLVCDHILRHSSQTYSRTDIAQIDLPCPHARAFYPLIALGGSAIAAAIFPVAELSIPGAAALAVVGGALMIAALLADLNICLEDTPIYMAPHISSISSLPLHEPRSLNLEPPKICQAHKPANPSIYSNIRMA